MKQIILCVSLCCGAAAAFGQTFCPSFEEVISLRSVGSAVMSPDGRMVAYTVQTTDWNDNRYDQEIWLSKDGRAPIQFTFTAKGSSSNPAFSPDNRWLSFLADRGSKSQVFVMSVDGGEAKAITREDEGISAFEWHPDGSRLILLKPEKDDKKEREKRYGSYEADDREFVRSHLWQIDFRTDLREASEMPCHETVDSLKVKSGCIQLPVATRLTEGQFTVTAFITSPDGAKVALSHQPDPLINSGVRSDISLLDLKTRKLSPLVTNPSGDGLEDWSPDSRELLFTTNGSDTTSNFYANSKLYVITIESLQTRQLAKDLDEDLGGFVWKKSGIYGTLWNKTRRPLYKINPVTGAHAVFLQTPEQIFGISFSQSGDQMAMTARNGDELTEVYRSPLALPKPERISKFNAQISAWRTARSEVISWKSRDGATIEGVLHKPSDYNPSRKYPLLVVIHGGPTGIDTPTPVPGYVYPVLQWLDKGSLVLRVNYRGSAGYGEAFRSLNVKNLGVGDAWDVLSGIEYLESNGMIDPTRLGCMGWSQGGYISAFLTTTSDRFKAISVGAGISNWMTYYVNTDIHPFTRQYLKATPWSDQEIYQKTSPMTYINQAKTPTLIQHGELDRRVPIANAYELLQGLRDKGVPAELMVYKGFGHGINKPRERLAATWHNWQWFGQYIWGEHIELPLGQPKDQKK